MRKLVALFFLVVASCALAEDVTYSQLVDLPPPTDEQIKTLTEGASLDPWPVRVDEYGVRGGSSLDLQEKLLGSPEAESEEEGEDSDAVAGEEDLDVAGGEEENADQGVSLSEDDSSAPLDLIDLKVSSLIPSIHDRRFKHIRSVLMRLRSLLRPLHLRLCPAHRHSTWSSSCLARRRANARILHSIVRRGCHVRRKCVRVVRRCPRHRPRCSHSAAAIRRSACRQGLCSGGKGELENVSHRYLYLRRTYARLYIQYALLLAKYFRSKFRTLAAVFVTTVKRLRWESTKAKKQNAELKAALARLISESRAMRDATAKEHKNQKDKYSQQQLEHQAHLKAALKAISQVKAELMSEKTKKNLLQKQLDDLNAELRRREENRQRSAARAQELAQQAADLSNKRKALLAQIGEINAKLRDADARFRQLEKLLRELNQQKRLLQGVLEATIAARHANERATERIQTAYNGLINQYDKLTKGNLDDDERMRQIINDLRDAIQRQAKRCSPDACGICGGDESSCALTRAGSTCYAVGDPHYRSFDGAYYNFQVTGQFILAKHGNPVNFEVQNLQRLSPAPWQPRLNKGIAVRGGRNIAIMYTDWGTNVMIINGVRTSMPLRVWQRIGHGFTVYRQSHMHAVFRYENSRRQPVVVSLEITPWVYGTFTSAFISVPWQWSSGRSMWGLCGNYDNWAGDDTFFLARNWGRLFHVSNSMNDMFVHPQQRAADIELDEFTPEDIELEKRLDAMNGVRGMEELEEYTEDDLVEPSPTAVELGDEADTNDAKGKIEKNTLGAASTESRELARKKCHGSHGAAREQCEFDILNGLPGKAARATFEVANMLAKERILKRCMHVGPSSFAIIAANSVSRIETAKEGYSYSFWYNPDSILVDRCVVLEKGANFFITQNGADLSFGAGAASCTARDVLDGKKWSAITMSIHHSGSLVVFVNDKEACVQKSVAGLPKNKNDLIIGGAQSGDACSGRIAHLHYIPQTTTIKEAKAHSTIKPFACKPKAPIPATSLLQEDEDEDDSDLESDD